MSEEHKNILVLRREKKKNLRIQQLSTHILALVCTENKDMPRHTTVTRPTVIITMYVSWKADIVAAQYDMDSVWNK
jgi:hypothetical protein